ncbi:membrane protein [Deinococcus malanensis]|uniref:Membrane protein n=1 Tax=Deinococcus malanensis TaxID=1706855 RepID=A0ABQ2ELK1_9DEIO|nr:tripartite tricarboxylate transporter TctB family protein [Deinococcus malanensis]GGK16368.1 membrane protein [Deinococcus malanensis]
MSEPVPPPSPEFSRPMRRRLSVPDLVVALAILALGLAVWLSARGITTGANVQVGPGIFPTVVGILLSVLGAVLTIGALRGDRAEPATEEDTDPNAPVNHVSPLTILGGFALGTALLNPLGFVIGGAIMFTSVAWAFGERRLGLVVIAALILALVTYLVFTRGLGLPLPQGIFRGVL